MFTTQAGIGSNITAQICLCKFNKPMQFYNLSTFLELIQLLVDKPHNMWNNGPQFCKPFAELGMFSVFRPVAQNSYFCMFGWKVHGTGQIYPVLCGKYFGRRQDGRGEGGRATTSSGYFEKYYKKTIKFHN